MKFKFDATKLLPVVVMMLGAAGTLLSNKVDANNRKAMKSEIKEELLKELAKSDK